MSPPIQVILVRAANVTQSRARPADVYRDTFRMEAIEKRSNARLAHYPIRRDAQA